MTRQVRFLADHGEFKADQIAVVDDQLAVDAIASGIAVPSIDPINAPETVAAEAAPEAAPEITAAEAAPEAVTPEPEAAAPEAAPETVAAEAAPEVA